MPGAPWTDSDIRRIADGLWDARLGSRRVWSPPSYPCFREVHMVRYPPSLPMEHMALYAMEAMFGVVIDPGVLTYGVETHRAREDELRVTSPFQCRILRRSIKTYSTYNHVTGIYDEYSFRVTHLEHEQLRQFKQGRPLAIDSIRTILESCSSKQHLFEIMRAIVRSNGLHDAAPFAEPQPITDQRSPRKVRIRGR